MASWKVVDVLEKWRSVAPCGIVCIVDDHDRELYEKHAEELTRFATSLVGPSRAEDVVANAVLNAMTSAGWPATRRSASKCER